MSNCSFWWSHLLWSLVRQMPGLATPEDVRRVTRDLQGDPFLCFLERRQHLIPNLFGLGLLAGGWAAGGWPLGLSLLVWGHFLRTVAGWHTTLLGNSVAHRRGYRNYDTPDNSRNCWWLALLAFGEGWHNNHHHQPRCAAHGHRWFEVDASYLLIRCLEAARLISNVVRPQRRARP